MSVRCRGKDSKTVISGSNKREVKHGPVRPKRTIISNSPSKVQSCSANIDKRSYLVSAKPNKTSKSDNTLTKELNMKTKSLDLCNVCGDMEPRLNDSIESFHLDIRDLTNSQTSLSKKSVTSVRFLSTERDPKVVRSMQQYYKNEHFQHQSESIHDINEHLRKISLDTIKELPEKTQKNIEGLKSETKVFSVHTQVDCKDAATNTEFERVKEFRERNFFECHSSESRLQLSDKGKCEQCVYRFYLNERLFPEPVKPNHDNNIRCIECHLPWNGDEENQYKNTPNGTIQAKVRIGPKNKCYDTMLVLPVESPLIIKEKRKEVKPRAETVYYGVIKLNHNGDSVFNRTVPNDSLALRYQRGYKELVNHYDHDNEFDTFDKNDVIII